MTETSKIKPIAIKYCEGCGVDLGCGNEKIKPEAIGIDSGLDFLYGPNKDKRDLTCVNIKQQVEDLGIFADGSLDYVYTSHFLEHLKNPSKMIEDIKRALRVGGNLVVYLPDRNLYTENNPEHHNMWTASEFIELLPENMDVVHRIDKHEDYSFFVVARKIA